ncbi:hypothetical protein [Ralstonia phage RP13]|nr:hypothetical protein [Ralstonia phage RP13]
MPQDRISPEELIRKYELSYDERLTENRIYTYELELLPDDVKDVIKAELRRRSNRPLHLSSASDPMGINELPTNSEALLFFDGINAREQRINESMKK